MQSREGLLQDADEALGQSKRVLEELCQWPMLRNIVDRRFRAEEIALHWAIPHRRKKGIEVKYSIEISYFHNFSFSRINGRSCYTGIKNNTAFNLEEG